jgi:hypothetical protein
MMGVTCGSQACDIADMLLFVQNIPRLHSLVRLLVFAAGIPVEEVGRILHG